MYMKRTALALTLILALLFSAVVGTQVVNFASARSFENIIIKADGSISPSTAPIKQTGNIYALTSDMHGDIALEANNIVLDGKGYALLGEVSVAQVSNVTVKNFIITETAKQLQGPTVGILLNETSNVLVTNNTITGIESILAWNWGPYAGIYVAGGTSNTISQNNLVHDLDGMVFIKTSNNLVTENNVTGNPNYELYSTGISFVNASNNAIYHNNFINNTYHVRESGSVNTWDDGYPFGGNYWSDYLTKYPNASQIGSSGIGDTPYVIDANNQDHYPLMAPVGVPNPSPSPSPSSSPQEPEPFPTMPVAAASIIAIVVVGAGLLVYFKKRQKESGDKT
jgi:parallel beta-helix repeat protein